MATQLISRLRESLQMEIPIREIFTCPTVVQLDPRLSQLKDKGNQINLPVITPRDIHTDSLPLSWTQERLWFLNQLEGANATWH